MIIVIITRNIFRAHNVVDTIYNSISIYIYRRNLLLALERYHVKYDTVY